MLLIVPGVIFAVEPMIDMGGAAVALEPANGWTMQAESGLPWRNGE
ncbi:MAG: hypothetical protein V8Q84_03345 [Bilophila sp.]